MCKDGACGHFTDDDGNIVGENTENDSPEVLALKKELHEMTEGVETSAADKHAILAHTLLDIQRQALSAQATVMKALKVDIKALVSKAGLPETLEAIGALLELKQLHRMAQIGEKLYNESSKEVPIVAKFDDLSTRIQAQAAKEKPEGDAKPEVEIKFAFEPAEAYVG